MSDIEQSDRKQPHRLLWTVLAVLSFIVTSFWAILFVPSTFYNSMGEYLSPGLPEILTVILVAILSPTALAWSVYKLWRPRQDNMQERYVWTALVLVLFGRPSLSWFFQYVGHATATYETLRPEDASSLRVSGLRIAIYPLAVCAAWLYLIWRGRKTGKSGNIHDK